jgi:hypothetical protein
MLVRLEITERQPVLDGQSFGDTGAYEQLEGRAHFALDPQHSLNAPIVDLALAPRNGEDRVECSADFWILQPVEAARGNGNLLYYVVNRGRKGALSTFNLAAGSNRPQTPAEFGDGLLMQQGYTVAACGWQADVPPEAPDNPHLLTLNVPTINATGPVSCEILVDETTQIHSLGSRYHAPYEVADGCEQIAQLSVRERPYETATPIARSEWSFDRLDDGRAAIYYAAGFQPGLIYNLVYTGKDPRVMGLGLAVTRDFVSHLKSSAYSSNPSKRAYGFGSSQSGRFLRHLLYEGFNEDEDGRQVFDALQVNVAGAGRGSFNHRFAQPSRHASAHFDVFYPTEQFPFSDAVQTDPHSGQRGGLLDRCRERGVTPKVFYINSSSEYWNRGGSLIHTDVDGCTDLEIAPEVRIYHFASTQHGAAELPSGPDILPGNPVDFRLGHRALLLALDRWVRDGIVPPASRYPQLADGTLVDPHGALFTFPSLPGLVPPTVHRTPRRLDHGPDWPKGIIGTEPPAVGHQYAALVPAIDADGNELAGIRLPEVAVPLGTFVGWRLRSEQMGAPWAMVGLAGAWLPFAACESPGDPRPTLAVRYVDIDDYAERCVQAAHALVAEQLLLERDITRVDQRARQMYEWVMQQT